MSSKLGKGREGACVTAAATPSFLTASTGKTLFHKNKQKGQTQHCYELCGKLLIQNAVLNRNQRLILP